ncbi:CocE/NonD family hydrolase [Neptunicoccus sediminis]|uniref:CocE/NonD family hydrolase n=1 Tax=Neptunicoccus sediminis TaxID=1892596 RepID=UPI000AED3A44|nr:CocE/NonD family hydrolase [Neptunicoccus sediminis]
MPSETIYRVEEEANLRIPLSNGMTLSARVWRPVGCGPVPVILEYLPYRKRDGTAARDALTHPYMAARGYVCVRVDTRGCGESDGLFDDEYSEQELSDGVEVVNWLAAQDWCSGAVGMMGISWGGFNGLQIAARAPEPLKAVVTLCSTTDRFADDIHYKGGIMLGENPGWAATVLSWFSTPPDPELVGEDWRDIWLNRLEHTPFPAERWVTEQVRSDYWAHGSVCEDYSAIKAAVLTVGGWHDGYRNTMGHLVDNLTAPVKGIAGPWNHKYPHFAVPGPQIDFLDEMLRWWDHWLKGIDRGVEADPAYRCYVMDSVAPQTSFTHRAGRWVGLEQPRGAGMTRFYLNGTRLAGADGPVSRTVATDLACGRGTGEYFPFGFGPGELPDDQSGDDALSMCFDSDPLEHGMDIVGRARVKLALSSDRPRAQIAVRLNDLRPDGSSALIAHGFLNLRQRDGAAVMVDMPRDETVEVQVLLDQAAYHLPEGHRLRIALSPSYFPFVWPEAEAVTLGVSGGCVELPHLAGEGVPIAFDGPKSATPLPLEQVTPRAEHKDIRIEDQRVLHEILGENGLVRNPETGLETREKVHEVFSVARFDPSTASARFAWERSYGRGDWRVSVHSVLQMETVDAGFLLTAELRAFEEAQEVETEVFRKDWRVMVPRM